jgi:hypothetical protein
MTHISWFAIIVATVLSFGLGAVWYGPLFGKAWMAKNGFTEEQIRQGANPAKLYGATFALSLLSVLVFGWFVGPDPGLGLALGAGLAVGLGWIATAIGTNYLFEAKMVRHFAINAGYHVGRFVINGLVFGVMRQVP